MVHHVWVEEEETVYLNICVSPSKQLEQKMWDKLGFVMRFLRKENAESTASDHSRQMAANCTIWKFCKYSFYFCNKQCNADGAIVYYCFQFIVVALFRVAFLLAL